MFGRERKTRRQWANRPAKATSMRPTVWQQCTDGEILLTALIVIGFWVGLTAILFLRRNVIAYRPGQYISHDITARVDFEYFDKEIYDQRVAMARQDAERVYRQSPGDVWAALQTELLNLPVKIHGSNVEELDPPLRGILDSGSLTQLEQMRSEPQRSRYDENVEQFIAYSQQHLLPENQPLVILTEDDRNADTKIEQQGEHRRILLLPAMDAMHPDSMRLTNAGTQQFVDVDDQTFSTKLSDSIKSKLDDFARDSGFGVNLAPKIARLALAKLGSAPTYQLDPAATAARQNAMAAAVDPRDANIQVSRNMVIVPQSSGVISDADFQVLRAENDAYYQSLTNTTAGLWQYRLGIFMLAAMFTIILCAYVARAQAKCLRNHVRALSLAGLLLSSLAITELAGIGSTSIYFFGIAPTILTAMILAIAYDQRFALGIATIHAMMVTAALNLGLPFMLILWVGLATACYLLDDVRTRQKLIEVGGISAIAMILVTGAIGASQLVPLPYIGYDCLYTGAAGLAAGLIALGILPFIERIFRITTSMTLLELADASKPLLRRLALEAPGTYNHSLQVATLSEAAAEAIGANGLLCRVGSYYHDIGKIKKPDYFIENQTGGESRHLNLNPTLSRQIIFSHVKDGIEIAKQENLPTSILPIIQQHHGTTLVEYFYHQAVTQNDQQSERGPKMSETEFRYPGPKPRSKEAAAVMLSDAVESTARSMAEPTPSRIETLVHDLAMKRLHDGQFDEVDLTLKDLALMESSLVKTLTGIYHGRVAYPSTAAVTSKPVSPIAEPPAPAVKSA